MRCADLSLSRRLENAEGDACIKFAEAALRADSDCGTAWLECAGARAVFHGPGSPVTQTFGLGLFQELTTSSLDAIEQFFFVRGAAAVHEISPFAGIATMDLLCDRGYRPVELSNVLYGPVAQQATRDPGPIRVRVTGAEEAPLWTEVSARGWTSDHPELLAFMSAFGAVLSVREASVCFLAEIDGQPGAAGLLSLHEGVALFCGAATVPEMRCRGLQSALLRERMRYAADHGCDLAMMVAEVGSSSQRNAERSGFRIAYTRTKWRRALPTASC